MLFAIILVISISSVSADELENTTLNLDKNDYLINQITNSNEGEEILIEPGTYKIHNIKIDKNLTLKGNSNSHNIIINGEGKSSIFLIKNISAHVIFKNITFINGVTKNFGGAISIECGNVYVDNCIFINNTALNYTNAGAISNYGNVENRSYLFVNNSLFLNNHADHDGGAITTCYASSEIYNCVFINNSAHRDGGAIRVSVYGKSYVSDCIFIYNHADEWGGAYYSWSGISNINRCIFINNTAGTNGGALMVSGNFLLRNSIIVNNSGGESGGFIYIQQPMYKAKTYITLSNNLITNNTSPYAKEIHIKWKDIEYLYTNFNDNDWGDENPNDPNVIDPDNVSSRSKVKSTKKSNLLNELNLDLLNRYSDLLKNYRFPHDYFNKTKDNSSKKSNDNINTNINHIDNMSPKLSKNSTIKRDTNKKVDNIEYKTNNNHIINNSTSPGDTSKSVKKSFEIKNNNIKPTINSMNILYLLLLIVIILSLIIGYRKK